MVRAGECNFGTDMDFTNLKMRERIDTIKSVLPDDADEPMLFKVRSVNDAHCLFMGLLSQRNRRSHPIVENKIQNRLERVPAYSPFP